MCFCSVWFWSFLIVFASFLHGCMSVWLRGLLIKLFCPKCPWIYVALFGEASAPCMDITFISRLLCRLLLCLKDGSRRCASRNFSTTRWSRSPIPRISIVQVCERIGHMAPGRSLLCFLLPLKKWLLRPHLVSSLTWRTLLTRGLVWTCACASMSSVASGAVLWLYASGGSFKIVPMTRVTERHFWDCFPKLPVATTDTAKWKAVLKYLDGCPEKAKSGPNAC